MLEGADDGVDEPSNTGDGASRVDTTEMLQETSQEDTPPQRGPLQKQGEMRQLCSSYLVRTESSHFLEGLDKRPVEEVSDEELITAGDRCSEASEGHSRTTLFSVWELATRSDDDADDVQRKGKREQLASTCKHESFECNG